MFRANRPADPLDSPAEIDGPALETLVLQVLRAINDYRALGYDIQFWRTRHGLEIDFVLYGERGLIALEIKRASTVNPADLRASRECKQDHPEASCLLLYGGAQRLHFGDIRAIPIREALHGLEEILVPEPAARPAAPRTE